MMRQPTTSYISVTYKSTARLEQHGLGSVHVFNNMARPSYPQPQDFQSLDLLRHLAVSRLQWTHGLAESTESTS